MDTGFPYLQKAMRRASLLQHYGFKHIIRNKKNIFFVGIAR
jgi:hypothetical protein